MAVTITLAVQDASILSGQPAKFTATLENDGSEVSVTDFRIVTPLASPANTSSSLSFPGSDPTVPAAGSQTANFEVVFLPRESQSISEWTYDVSLVCNFSDGTYAESSAVEITVSAPE